MLVVADVFSVFTAKNTHRISKNIDRMRPKTSRLPVITTYIQTQDACHISMLKIVSCLINCLSVI